MTCPERKNEPDKKERRLWSLASEREAVRWRCIPGVEYAVLVLRFDEWESLRRGDRVDLMGRARQDRGVGHHLFVMNLVAAVRLAGKQMLNDDIAIKLLDMAPSPDLADFRAVCVTRVLAGEVNHMRRRFDRDVAGEAQFRDKSAAHDFLSGIHVRHTPHHQVDALEFLDWCADPALGSE